ncbi:MAG: DUF6624 domain-containing protein [bacterium]
MMTSTRSAALALVTTVWGVVASPRLQTDVVGANQQKCRVDSSAAWFVKQRVWLDDSKHAWSDDTLRVMLVRAAGMSADARGAIQLGWQVEGVSASASAGDSVAIAALRKLAATRGAIWPVKSVSGALGARAVWVLAQHDTALARAALKRMMEAGPEESNAADVATLEDRLRLQSGRKQIYGTQFRRDAAGVLSLASMEDSAHVDLRREDAGLPPFRISACLARSMRAP